MDRIFTAQNVKRLEELSAQFGVRHRTLMENAGNAAGKWIFENIKPCVNAVILCGKGNNGGDGYVIASYLKERKVDVTVLQTHGMPVTEDATQMYERAVLQKIPMLDSESDAADRILNAAQVIIDAVYGIGFHGELDEKTAYLFQKANVSGATKIAIDIPSGTECDTSRVAKDAFCADVTLSFSCFKPAQIHTPSKEYCGSVEVLSIGIPNEAYELIGETQKWIEKDDVINSLPMRPAESNKGSFGKLLCVCGSYGMAGAAVLAAKGALRSGVGLVQLAIDERIYPIVASHLLEPVMLPYSAENTDKVVSALKGATSVLFGCGSGTSQQAEKMLLEILENCKGPLVLDADGINLASRHKDKLRTAECVTVMTPHPGEMARFFDCTVSEIQQNRVEYAVRLSREYNVVTALKGQHTVIADPNGKVWVNPTGNSGMAKGGSGDLLAGMMGSFLAQKMNVTDAVKAAVWCHGAVGDMCALNLSERGMLPSDMADNLSKLFLNLQNR